MPQGGVWSSRPRPGAGPCEHQTLSPSSSSLGATLVVLHIRNLSENFIDPSDTDDGYGVLAPVLGIQNPS